MRLPTLVLCASLLLCMPAAALTPVEPDRRIAITIDDLPWAGIDSE